MTHWRCACAAALALTVACGGGAPASSDAGPPAPPTEAEQLARRPYAAEVPPGYTAARAWPLLLVLGGYGSSGRETADWMRLAAMAAVQGVFLATPDATRDRLGYFAWNAGPDHAPQYDVEYLTAVIHDLEAKYAIDRARVFVAGHSLGAHMAHRMACDASAEVAAIASAAGQVTKYAPACAPGRAVSVVQIHGTLDPVIGYSGDVQNTPPDPSVPSAHETVGVWARNDACAGPIAPTGATRDFDDALPGAETTVEAYSGCPPGIGVELWSVVGAGHLPHFNAGFAAALWGFLSGHARQ